MTSTTVDNSNPDGSDKQKIDHRESKRKSREKVLSDEERANISLVEWSMPEQYNKKGPRYNKKGPRSPQLNLLYHGWATNDTELIHKMLALCQSKSSKFWIDNMKRALHSFKPPEYERKTWDAFHELFKANALPQQYEKASVLIFPVIGSSSSSSSSSLSTADDANSTENDAVQLDQNSLEQSYEMFQKMVSNSQESAAAHKRVYKGPSLRCIAMLLSVCCKHLDASSSSDASLAKNGMCLKIARDVQSIVRRCSIDTVTTVSTGYFDALFEIFAVNRVSIDMFNELFVQFYATPTEYNQVVEASTCEALKSYWTRLDSAGSGGDGGDGGAAHVQMEIHDNLVSDVDGYLFFDEDKTRQLSDIRIPKFYLSVTKNSEIWEQLRLTAVNDAAAAKCERKQLLANETRARKLGLLPANANASVDDGATKKAEKTENAAAAVVGDGAITISEEDQRGARRKRKYEQFIKYMLSDGGAEVVIDGANVGHMLLQDHFSFDFVDHVASYYANVQQKKVRIIMCQYRVVNGENSGNPRIKKIIAKWMKHSWLIQSPNMLYDDVLWSIYTLHSCLVYNENVVVVTNDTMRDHALALHRIKGFDAWLQTKLCRVEVVRENGAIAYDPFGAFTASKTATNTATDTATNTATDTGKKRTLQEMEEKQDDSGEPAAKKQKNNDGEAAQAQESHGGGGASNVDSANDMFASSYIQPPNSHSKYGYINKVYPFRLHPPCAYILRPQYYRYESEEKEHFVWFLPQMSKHSDVQNKKNILKQCYPEAIINKRIRWTVAKLTRKIAKK